jgi:hypothetical protein
VPGQVDQHVDLVVADPLMQRLIIEAAGLDDQALAA